VNLKIKPAQSFIGAHRGRVCVRVFIGVSARTCISICVSKKNSLGVLIFSSSIEGMCSLISCVTLSTLKSKETHFQTIYQHQQVREFALVGVDICIVRELFSLCLHDPQWKELSSSCHSILPG
jgi:hypothetical protein